MEYLCNTAKMQVGNLLSDMFGIQADENDEYLHKSLFEIGKDKLYQHICKRYKNRIMDNAKRERIGYQNYIKGLKMGERIGFVNFVCRGVTQRCIEKIMHREMKGFYFASEDDIVDIYPKQENIFTRYGKYLSTHTSKLHITEQLLFGETVLTSPAGSLQYFEESGKPVFEQQNNPGFEGIRQCQDGIKEYVRDLIVLQNGIGNDNFSNQLIDHIFGLMSSEYVAFSDEIKEYFTFQNWK